MGLKHYQKTEKHNSNKLNKTKRKNNKVSGTMYFRSPINSIQSCRLVYSWYFATLTKENLRRRESKQ